MVWLNQRLPMAQLIKDKGSWYYRLGFELQ